MLTGEQFTGGVAMAQQGLSSSDPPGSAQIWAGLPAECRASAVRLMVQLALKVVVT